MLLDLIVLIGDISHNKRVTDYLFNSLQNHLCPILEKSIKVIQLELIWEPQARNISRN